MQQQKFVEQICQGVPQHIAKRVAGYKEETKCAQLLAVPAVAEAIKKYRTQMSKKAAITREDVLEGFQDAVRASANAMEMVAAWREIGKLLGYYSEKIEVEHKLEKILGMRQEQLENVSTHDLLRIANMDMDGVIDGEYEDSSDTDD